MKWEETAVIVRKRSFKSGSWQMDQDKDGVFYISHRSLILSPTGIGKTECESFEHMLTRIADYRKKLDTVEAEIQQHLAELKGEAKPEA